MPDNPDIDELGLPRFIVDDNREVSGNEPNHELTINLLEQSAETDKIRIIFRNGTAMIIQEMWDSGVVVCSIQTAKGQAPFSTYDPRKTGFGAMRVSAPINIL